MVLSRRKRIKIEDAEDLKRRKRDLYIIIATMIFMAGLTMLETVVYKQGGTLPVANNILIFLIININIILLILIIYLLIRNLTKLFFERRSKILGARLKTKLVVAFVSLSLIPTLLLFFFSIAFISDSIENWFGMPIESSLKEAMEVSKSYYQDRSENAIYHARQLSKKIKERKLMKKNRINSLRWYAKAKGVEYNLGSIEVFSSQQKELVKEVHPDIPKELFSLPESTLVKDGLLGKEASLVQAVGKGDMIRGVAPIYSTFKEDDIVGAVIVTYYIPQRIVSKMTDINKAYQEYKQLKIVKYPVKVSYLMTLLMVTLIIIFAAIWFGLYLAKGITVPIQLLAEGTNEVANGNLDFNIDLESKDELGTLVSSFNKMTQDLKISKESLEKTNLDLENRRRYIEIILRDVAAGVISTDKLGRVSTINKSAEMMLGISAEDVIGKKYKEVVGKSYQELIKTLVRDAFSSGGTIERETTISLKGESVTLLVSLSVMKDERGGYIGMVLVFDDLTELIKGQRAATWREVARRIAHEIKNPLTPIQLSAQRLQKKFGANIQEDGQIFSECTSTIIKQVDELKALVNEFSSFARLPTANPVPSDIEALLQETISLYREAHGDVKIELISAGDIPSINLDKGQVKRVFINLLENAVDAISKGGTIKVSTEHDKKKNMVYVEVADNGPGIPPKDMARLFEPYFSTKKGGTGLGLAIVDTIMKDHKGTIRVRKNSPRGTRFTLGFPLSA